MAPKTAGKETPADEQSMLKRPAAAVDAERARKMLKRPAAAAAAGEGEDEEAEDAVDGEEAEEEEEAQKVLKRPAEATLRLKRPAAAEEEDPEAEDAAEEEEEEAPKVMKKPAEAVEAPTEEAPKREKQPKPLSRTQEFINAVHSTIASIVHKASPAAGVKLHPAALTSFDKDGFPSSRTVIPSYIADDLTEIHLTSQAGTRKESELSANPKASLHFQDQRGKGGWATLKCTASVRPAEGGDKVEIVLRPTRVELMSYNTSTMGDASGWKPAIMIMTSAGVWRRTDTGAAASGA